MSGIIGDLKTIFISNPIGPAGIKCGNRVYNLLGTLHSCCEFQSTIPKDKVYGILSLVDSRAEVEGIDVDYDKEVGTVFADTVIADIRVHSMLTASAFVSHPQGYDGNPEYISWTPRWDNSEPVYVSDHYG